MRQTQKNLGRIWQFVTHSIARQRKASYAQCLDQRRGLTYPLVSALKEEESRVVRPSYANGCGDDPTPSL